jgi:hypothetical protein
MPRNVPSGGKTPTFVPDGYCGLYCGSCPSYLATKAGKATELGLDECQGCKSGVVAKSWCAACTLKACAREKGVEFCYECVDFPCQDLEDFKNASDWPYHSEIYDYMTIIKEAGQEAWLCSMRIRWGCPSCGKEASWWDQTCTDCGAVLNGYRKPTPTT